MDSPHHTAAEEIADECEEKAHKSAGNKSRAYRGFHPCHILSAKKPGNHNRGSQVGPYGKRHKYNCNGIRRPDCSQGVLSCKAAGNTAVRNIIDLLKHYAD